MKGKVNVPLKCSLNLRLASSMLRRGCGCLSRRRSLDSRSHLAFDVRLEYG